MKLNNKGISIIEIVLTFALIMVMVIGMITIIYNYREKANISLEKLDMVTFKNTLTKDIQDDILEKGVEEINWGGECTTAIELNSCINIVFKDGTNKIFGTSLIDENDKNSIENKYLYYGDIKYKLKDTLPETIPEGRKITDFQAIEIQDSNILSTDSIVLEDGTVITIYLIDVYISHIDFEQDFGIHIVTYTDNIINNNEEEIKDVTVKFNAGEGECNTESLLVSSGKKYGTLPLATRLGYEFLGWFTTENGGTQVLTDTIVETTEEHTLYAQWKQKYLVANDSGKKVVLDGSLLTQTHYLTWINNTGAPVKLNITFKNMRYDTTATESSGGCGAYINQGGTYAFNENKVLGVSGGASWKIDSATVTINNGYGLYIENQHNAQTYITVEIVN